jgi:hypothetical protein
MATDLTELQNRLWEAADQLRANSGLRASEYSTPVLGLIFLRYADFRFAAAHQELEGKGSGRRKVGPGGWGGMFVQSAHFVEPAIARTLAQSCRSMVRRRPGRPSASRR